MNGNEHKKKENKKEIYGWVLENEDSNTTEELKEEFRILKEFYCPFCGFQIKICPNCKTEFNKPV